MQSFMEFLTEANEDNDHKATAYEARVAMHLHDRTAAKDNKDPVFRQAHDATVARYHERMAKLSTKDREDVEKAADTSATGYLKSLEKHEGIKPEDVREVHHTAKGIDQHIGRKVNQLMNPHDVLIKTNNGDQHGSSLKMSTKSQTVNNSTMKSYDDLKQQAGLGGNSNDMWTTDRKERFGDAKATEIKNKVREMRKSGAPEYKDEQDEHMKTRTKIAKQQADHFNNGTHEQKQKFLSMIAKSSPDLPYHYTAGDKDYSVPIHEHPAVKKILNAKELKAVHNGTSSYAIHDHEGNQLMHFDFRTNHGPWTGPVVTGSYGNLKPVSKAKQKKLDQMQTQPQTPQNPSGNYGSGSRLGMRESINVYAKYLSLINK